MTQGCAAQPRSPASQNIMPRNWPLSASTSTSVTSAPQALATTTPVSSTRTVAPPRASASTSSVASIAPDGRRALHDPQRPAEQQREQGADRRAAGDTEHIRIRERIAEQRLQQHARQRQQRADGERRQQSRRAQFQHDGARRFRGVAEQCCDGRAHADVGGTGDQSQAGDDGRDARSARQSSRVVGGREVTAHCPYQKLCLVRPRGTR